MVNGTSLTLSQCKIKCILIVFNYYNSPIWGSFFEFSNWAKLKKKTRKNAITQIYTHAYTWHPHTYIHESTPNAGTWGISLPHFGTVPKARGTFPQNGALYQQVLQNLGNQTVLSVGNKSVLIIHKKFMRHANVTTRSHILRNISYNTNIVIHLKCLNHIN